MFSLAWTLMTNHRPNPDQHVGVNPRPLREYNVTLSSGKLSTSSLEVQSKPHGVLWELAEDRTLKLVDVRLTDEW